MLRTNDKKKHEATGPQRIESAKELLDEIQKKFSSPRAWELEKEACKTLLDQLSMAIVSSVKKNQTELLTEINKNPANHFSFLPHDYSLPAIDYFTNDIMHKLLLLKRESLFLANKNPDNSGARFALVLAEDEMANQRVTVKDLTGKQEQQTLSLEAKKKNKPAKKTDILPLTSSANLAVGGIASPNYLARDMRHRAIQVLLEKGFHADLDKLNYHTELNDTEYDDNADLLKLLIKQSSTERKINALKIVISEYFSTYHEKNLFDSTCCKLIATLLEDNGNTEDLFKQFDKELQVAFLFYVCLHGSNQLLELLLENCPQLDVNAVDSRFNAALQLALNRARTEAPSRHFRTTSESSKIISTLIRKGVKDVFWAKNGQPSINQAIQMRRTDLVKLFIERGVGDLETHYDRRRNSPLPSPLLLAIYQKDREIVEILLKSQKLPSAVTRIIDTIYDEQKGPVAKQLILDRGSKLYFEDRDLPSALGHLIYKRNVKKVQELLDIDKKLGKRTFINDIDMRNGYTPLMLAIVHWAGVFKVDPFTNWREYKDHISEYEERLTIIEKLLAHKEIDLDSMSENISGPEDDDIISLGHYYTKKFDLEYKDMKILFTSNKQIFEFAKHACEQRRQGGEFSPNMNDVYALVCDGMRLDSSSRMAPKRWNDSHSSTNKNNTEELKKKSTDYLLTQDSEEKLKQVLETEEAMKNFLVKKDSTSSFSIPQREDYGLPDRLLLPFVEIIMRSQALYRAIMDSATLTKTNQRKVIKIFNSSNFSTSEMKYNLGKKYNFELDEKFKTFDFYVRGSNDKPMMMKQSEIFRSIIATFLTYKDMCNLIKLRKQLNEKNNNSDDNIMFLMNLTEENNNDTAIKQTAGEAPKALLTT